MEINGFLGLAISAILFTVHSCSTFFILNLYFFEGKIRESSTRISADFVRIINFLLNCRSRSLSEYTTLNFRKV